MGHRHKRYSQELEHSRTPLKSNPFSPTWLAIRERNEREKTGSVGVALEIPLHGEIKKDLDFKRWPYIHQRTYKRTTNDKNGAPDFIVFAPGGVKLIEVKKRLGKQSPAQRDWAYDVARHGYEVKVVRSFEEYQEAIV